VKFQVLLDASAVLAVLGNEPGAEHVALALHNKRCAVTAANQAEIISKCLDRGATPERLQVLLNTLGYSVLECVAADGQLAGDMRPLTRSLGLSLGDRLCLAVAKRLSLQVLTADRPWLSLQGTLGLDIVCIRPVAH
jgi:ribonuclease VapC